MAKTSRDAYRHMRALSDFFAEMGWGEAFSRTTLDEFIATYRHRKQMKQTIARLIARGYLVEKGLRVTTTQRGLLFFRRRYPASLTKEALHNGKWYLLSFDIPVSLNSKRVALARILRRYEFMPLQKSVWVGPHGLAKDVWEFIADQKIERYCTPMIVDILEGDDVLRKHFNIK